MKPLPWIRALRAGRRVAVATAKAQQAGKSPNATLQGGRGYRDLFIHLFAPVLEREALKHLLNVFHNKSLPANSLLLTLTFTARQFFQVLTFTYSRFPIFFPYEIYQPTKPGQSAFIIFNKTWEFCMTRERDKGYRTYVTVKLSLHPRSIAKLALIRQTFACVGSVRRRTEIRPGSVPLHLETEAQRAQVTFQGLRLLTSTEKTKLSITQDTVSCLRICITSESRNPVYC